MADEAHSEQEAADEGRPAKRRLGIPVIGTEGQPKIDVLTPEQMDEAMFGPPPEEGA
jgi:hypothetical protein